MLPTLPTAMASLMPMLVFPSAPAVVLTQSLRDLLFPLILGILDTMDTTLARGLLMLMLMLSMLPTLTLPLSLMPEFPLAPALVSTPSPKVLMLPPRDMPPSMDTLDTTDTTLARGLLMLMLSMLPTLMPPRSPMLMPEFPSDPALVLTPSPRVLMPPPRDMPPTSDTPLATMLASKLESFL